MRPRAARQMAACVRGAAPAHLCRAARFSTRGPYREMDTSSPWRFREVDTALAGLGLFGSISVLGYVESFTGVPLFAPPMLASGIIFFIFPRPPEPKGFLSGTFCSSTLSLAALAVLSPVLPPVAAHGAAASVLLMWYKATGSCFPPAAVLAGTLAATSASASASFESAATFLACPWLAGHVWMYGCAHALSIVRSRARITLTKAALVDESVRDTPYPNEVLCSRRTKYLVWKTDGLRDAMRDNKLVEAAVYSSLYRDLVRGLKNQQQAKGGGSLKWNATLSEREAPAREERLQEYQMMLRAVVADGVVPPPRAGGCNRHVTDT